MIELREMTVLIADDSMPMCNSIHAMMRTMKYGRRFLFANNGKDAMDLLKKHKEEVDLLLLDYNMPMMTGAEILRYIRDGRDMRDLPVIMITAQAYEEYVAETGESEIDAYLLKPFTTKLLEQKVATVVDQANNPPPMMFHLKRARKFEEEGDFESAIQEAQLAKEARPESTKPIRELGYFYYKNGDLTKAELWLSKAASMNPLDVFAFHYLGELHLKLNNIEKASRYFEKAMKLSPRQVKRGIDFGKILIQRNMEKKAIQVFNKVVELPGCTPDIREQIADFCIQQDVDQYAARLLENLADEFKNRADLCFKLGRLWKKIGKLEKAVSFLAQAAEIDKNSIEIRLHLAKDYLALKKPILAEKPLIEILEINRNHNEAKELLKQCY